MNNFFFLNTHGIFQILTFLYLYSEDVRCEIIFNLPQIEFLSKIPFTFHPPLLFFFWWWWGPNGEKKKERQRDREL